MNKQCKYCGIDEKNHDEDHVDEEAEKKPFAFAISFPLNLHS